VRVQAQEDRPTIDRITEKPPFVGMPMTLFL